MMLSFTHQCALLLSPPHFQRRLCSSFRESQSCEPASGALSAASNCDHRAPRAARQSGWPEAARASGSGSVCVKTRNRAARSPRHTHAASPGAPRSSRLALRRIWAVIRGQRRCGCRKRNFLPCGVFLGVCRLQDLTCLIWDQDPPRALVAPLLPANPPPPSLSPQHGPPLPSSPSLIADR